MQLPKAPHLHGRCSRAASSAAAAGLLASVQAPCHVSSILQAATRYCMVHVDTPADTCRQWNAARPADGAFSEAIFEDLAGRWGRHAGAACALAGCGGWCRAVAGVVAPAAAGAQPALPFVPPRFDPMAPPCCSSSSPSSPSGPAAGLSGPTRATAGMRRCSRFGPRWEDPPPCKKRSRRQQQQWRMRRRRSEGRQQRMAAARGRQQQMARQQQQTPQRMRRVAAWMGRRRCCRPNSSGPSQPQTRPCLQVGDSAQQMRAVAAVSVHSGSAIGAPRHQCLLARTFADGRLRPSTLTPPATNLQYEIDKALQRVSSRD